MSVTERFWSRVDRRSDDECWPWTAGKNDDGYGTFKVYPGELGWEGYEDDRPEQRKTVGAHRVAFYLIHGRWPDHACHHCDNPACCNALNSAQHIYDGNNSVNHQEKAAHDRHPPHMRRNSGQGASLFTDPAQYDRIVGMYEALGSCKAVAEMIGESKQFVYQVVKRAQGGPKAPVTPERTAEVLRRHAQGETHAQIATALNMWGSAVSKIIRRHSA